MSIRAVIFDFGGVLVRTEDQSPRHALAARLNLSPAELYTLIFENESARRATLGKIKTGEHWELVRRSLDLAEGDFSTVPQAFWGGDKLDLELVDFIRSLRPSYKTALLSNAWDDLRQVLVHTWKIADAFDEIIISAEVGVAKPDPEIYRITVERLGVAPREAVFVDDFIANVDAARAFGLQAVHFRSPEQARAELEKLLFPP